MDACNLNGIGIDQKAIASHAEWTRVCRGGRGAGGRCPLHPTGQKKKALGSPRCLALCRLVGIGLCAWSLLIGWPAATNAAIDPMADPMADPMSAPAEPSSPQPEPTPSGPAPSQPTPTGESGSGERREDAGVGEAGLLAGPSVPSTARSIVKRDAKGGFSRLSTRPEFEAARALDLDPETSAKIKDIVTEYRTRLGVLLVQNVDRAVEIADAVKNKDRDAAARLARELYSEFNPQGERDPLAAEVREVLDKEQSREFQRLLDEYWTEHVQWETRSRKPKDKTPEKLQETESKLAFQLFRDELKASYETTLQPYREKMERLEIAVEPTTAQREEIVAIVTAYIRETRTRPTPDQRREVMGKIYRVLDEDRRAKLFELVVSDVAAGMW